jgi:hypothetical protein
MAAHELVPAGGLAGRQPLAHEGVTLGDQFGIPSAAVLLVQRHQLPV